MEQQLALELMYWENLTGAEVAEALSVPVDTIYTRVRRASSHHSWLWRRPGRNNLLPGEEVKKVAADEQN